MEAVKFRAIFMRENGETSIHWFDSVVTLDKIKSVVDELNTCNQEWNIFSLEPLDSNYDRVTAKFKA
jgi:hypothetical protein